MATDGGRREKDGKLVGGPKLHIAPHQSPPGTPPPFLSLLDSFSALKTSLRSTLPTYAQTEARAHAANKSKANREKAASRKPNPDPTDPRAQTSPDSIATAQAALKKLEEDGVMFSSPIRFNDDDDGEDAARSRSVPPTHKANKSKSLKGKHSSSTAGGKADLRQQHALVDEDEELEGRPAEKLRRAVTEEEKQQERQKIDAALRLAESMLVGSRPYNRLDNVKYHGSTSLTFPSVQKFGGETYELDGGRERAVDKKKWEEHAKARAAGVTAMEQLLLRHHKMKEERDKLEEQLAAARAQLQHEKSTVREMQEQNKELEQERARLQRLVHKAEAAKDKDKQEQQREVSRLQELVRGARDKCERLTDEKNELEYTLESMEGSTRKHHEAVATLKKELQEKSDKERQDAGKMAKLVEEHARLVLAKEGLEHELEMLDEDFAYAKIKLRSAQQFAERVTREHHEKMKVLNEKLSSKLAAAEEGLRTESAFHSDLDQRLAAAEKDLAWYTERAGALEGELKRTREASHEHRARLAATSAELQTAQTKNRWSWLICLSLVLHAFPHNGEQQTQTESSLTAEQGTMTEFLSSSGEFARYWSEVMRAGQRLQLRGADGAGRMTVSELAGFVSATLARKVLADTVDAETHFGKQSLQEFMLTYFLEVSGDKDSAFSSLAALVANLDLYLAMGPSAKMAGSNPVYKRPAVGGGGGGAGGSRDGEVGLQLVAVMPRLQLFARFLGVDQDGVEPLPPDALSVYLAVLLRIRRGQYPLLPVGAEKVTVASADFVESMEHVLSQLKTHEKMALRTHFHKEVSLGKAQVDLDTALGWVTGRWMDTVHGKTDERLRSLFVAADADGDGNLDFDEYFGMIRRLRADQRELPPLPQLIRMYGRMLLSQRVDASVFVRIAREEELCPFTPGPAPDEVEVDKATFASLTEEWRRIEPATVQMMRRLEGKPEGMKLACDVAVLRGLLGRRLQPDHARIFLTCLTKVFHVPQALAPRPRQQGMAFISPAAAPRLAGGGGGFGGGGGGGGVRPGGGRKEAGMVMGKGGGGVLNWSELEALAPDLVQEEQAEHAVVSSLIPGLLRDGEASGMFAGGPPPKPTFDISDEDE